jgi:hypothetical protein
MALRETLDCGTTPRVAVSAQEVDQYAEAAMGKTVSVS